MHLVASSGRAGCEIAALLLANAHEKGLVEKNKYGQIPVHLACTEGSDNEKCLSALLKIHQEKKLSLSSRDSE
eukprot:5185802-Ditylum_brightwellii.AAC.1